MVAKKRYTSEIRPILLESSNELPVTGSKSELESSQSEFEDSDSKKSWKLWSTMMDPILPIKPRDWTPLAPQQLH